MEPNSIRAKHQKEVLLVAQDVFHYLSSSIYPQNAIQRSKEKSNYHLNIGKACSYRLKFARSSFRDICMKEFPNRILGSVDFVTWFEGVLARHSQESASPFSATMESFSLMFEAACYAFEKGQLKLYQILPIMFTNHFMHRVYPEFFNKGGWHAFIKLATETVESYETFFLTSEAGALELIAGYQEDPTPTEEGEKKAGSKASKEDIIPVPYMLQKAGFPAEVDRYSNLGKTLKGILNLSIGQGLIRNIMHECVMGATPKERLPGNRKVDPLRTYDTSPEISPRESPVCVRKNVGKDAFEKKKKEKSYSSESEPPPTDIPLNINRRKSKKRSTGKGKRA